MFLTKEIYWLMFYMFTSTITGVNCPLFLLMAKIVNSHDHIKKIDEGEWDCSSTAMIYTL